MNNIWLTGWLAIAPIIVGFINGWISYRTKDVFDKELSKLQAEELLNLNV
ncbi:hypothetical protein SNE25_15145 [Mucilaginibacter sabulilitoris]|uniref:Uncharacterized protein n=1 Tax=Mucilaginibacter sabulilitoris TaxID=1173583 RepID=A0ABZ0TUU5_9SPHI|nr:hypothetical protein [Mucilaginibacter sabulilitoris]WPU96857.1 hypothetical protein SNE25_15145 [Mucilaginibacter sabulilitoris]